jgi:transposase
MVYFKSNPKQIQLLPTDIRTLIPDNHICYLVERVTENLDYSDFDNKVEGPGNPSYHPRIYLKIILQGILEKVTSSRILERYTNENIIFRYLSEGLSPNFHSIAMFRKNNPKLLKECFLETVRIARDLEMVNSKVLYLDGTKIKANAAKNKIFSKEEIDFLSDYFDEELEKMERSDSEEDSLYGDSDGRMKIPEHLTNKKKLEEAIKKISKKPKEGVKKIKALQNHMKNNDLQRINITDPDSKLMKMKKGNFLQGYNCQILVEDKEEIVLCTDVSDAHSDVDQTIPLVEKYESEQGEKIDGVTISQDNGYFSPATLLYYKEKKVDAYIPDKYSTNVLRGKEHKIDEFGVDNFKLDFEKNQVVCPKGQILEFFKKVKIKKKSCTWYNKYKASKCKDCLFQKKCLKTYNGRNKFVNINPDLRRMRLKFETEEGKAIYNKRFHKGEVVQAHIIHNLGFTQFMRRNVENCKRDFDIVISAYNLKKIHNKILTKIVKKGNKTNKKIKNNFCGVKTVFKKNISILSFLVQKYEVFFN